MKSKLIQTYGLPVLLLTLSPLQGFATAQGDLLLKDFKPASQLKIKKQVIPFSKFMSIDFHSHVNDAYPTWGDEVEWSELIKVMDQNHVSKIVILTGKWGDELQKIIDQSVKKFPNRFEVFTEIDWSKIDEPNFAQSMALQIRDSVKRGARGLKIMKNFGLKVRYKSGELLKIDDPALDPIWKTCGELGIPVSIHVGDPDAFFTPIDQNNERYLELYKFPDWSFSANIFPLKVSLIDALERVFKRHPKTLFVSVHAGNWPENLDYVSEMLKRNSNVYIDFGARQAELGRQPHRARKFFIEYQDRILFGTDARPEPAMYGNYFRWLETDDDSFEYYGYPLQGFWKIYGLNLPPPVLKKIYFENAKKLLNRFNSSRVSL